VTVRPTIQLQRGIASAASTLHDSVRSPDVGIMPHDELKLLGHIYPKLKEV